MNHSNALFCALLVIGAFVVMLLIPPFLYYTDDLFKTLTTLLRIWNEHWRLP